MIDDEDAAAALDNKRDGDNGDEVACISPWEHVAVGRGSDWISGDRQHPLQTAPFARQ